MQRLIDMLLDDMPEHRASAAAFPRDEQSLRRLLRSLMNLRPPLPLRPEFLALQDELLGEWLRQKGVVGADALPALADPRLVLWRGDITRLGADAIVNAANIAMLGCFVPCHGCIDNAIHSAAGLQLRDDMNRLMQAQGHEEPTGEAKITPAYNLPSRYVIHTVGPIIRGALQPEDRDMLASCYRACLKLAGDYALKSIAFCCISTGEFRFPQEEAARIAIGTVREYLSNHKTDLRVIFNVFKASDEAIYRRLLAEQGL